jgi:hypothetical protein
VWKEFAIVDVVSNSDIDVFCPLVSPLALLFPGATWKAYANSLWERNVVILRPVDRLMWGRHLNTPQFWAANHH